MARIPSLTSNCPSGWGSSSCCTRRMFSGMTVSMRVRPTPRRGRGNQRSQNCRMKASLAVWPFLVLGHWRASYSSAKFTIW